MSDPFVQELELMVASLEKYGKEKEAQIIKEVIEEYCNDVGAPKQMLPGRQAEDCAEA